MFSPCNARAFTLIYTHLRSFTETTFGALKPYFLSNGCYNQNERPMALAAQLIYNANSCAARSCFCTLRWSLGEIWHRCMSLQYMCGQYTHLLPRFSYVNIIKVQFNFVASRDQSGSATQVYAYADSTHCTQPRDRPDYPWRHTELAVIQAQRRNLALLVYPLRV